MIFNQNDKLNMHLKLETHANMAYTLTSYN